MQSLGVLIPILGLLIPLAPFLLVGFIIWVRHQQKAAERAGPLGPAAAPYAERIRQLEERVRILERIVTEDSRASAVSAEIESLRHRRVPARNGEPG
jgi:hypothetical protein